MAFSKTISNTCNHFFYVSKVLDFLGNINLMNDCFRTFGKTEMIMHFKTTGNENLYRQQKHFMTLLNFYKIHRRKLIRSFEKCFQSEKE